MFVLNSRTGSARVLTGNVELKNRPDGEWQDIHHGRLQGGSWRERPSLDEGERAAHKTRRLTFDFAYWCRSSSCVLSDMPRRRTQSRPASWKCIMKAFTTC